MYYDYITCSVNTTMTYNYQFSSACDAFGSNSELKTLTACACKSTLLSVTIYAFLYAVAKCDFAAHQIDLESRMLCVYRSVRRGYYNMYSVLRVLQTQPGMDVNANIWLLFTRRRALTHLFTTCTQTYAKLVRWKRDTAAHIGASSQLPSLPSRRPCKTFIWK